MMKWHKPYAKSKKIKDVSKSWKNSKNDYYKPHTRSKIAQDDPLISIQRVVPGRNITLFSGSQLVREAVLESGKLLCNVRYIDTNEVILKGVSSIFDSFVKSERDIILVAVQDYGSACAYIDYSIDDSKKISSIFDNIVESEKIDLSPVTINPPSPWN